MRRRCHTAGLSVLPLLSVLFLLVAAPAAHAHPLGNFSLNHYDGLRFTPHAVLDTAVVDAAEIPTAQDQEATDTNHDGRVSAAEAAARAGKRCAQLAQGTQLTVEGEQLRWRVTHSGLDYRAGAGGLPVSRLVCTLRADAALDEAAAVRFGSAADPGRTGWKEITATGDGVRLTDSTVPTKSVSEALRHYPSGADAQSLDTTRAALRTLSGGDTGAGAAAPGEAPGPERDAVLFPQLEQKLTALTAERDLTLPVGLLAVLLTVLLGAGHAALPGHAKLAVAACLARRRGGVRAALAVGATVTVTHTAGVLVVGLLLTVSGGLVGEQLLGWLGALSGGLIAAIGGALVVSAVRALRGGRPAAWHHAHSHAHGHAHGHSQGHAHAHEHAHELPDGHASSYGHVHTPPEPHQGHLPAHADAPDDAPEHAHPRGTRPPLPSGLLPRRRQPEQADTARKFAGRTARGTPHTVIAADGPTGAVHTPRAPAAPYTSDTPTTPPHPSPADSATDAPAGTPPRRRRRRLAQLPLVGVGLAGGLVPSPSALVVLLGAVALSHTAFGVLLVLGYGLGMAGMLTLAGLVLAGGGSRLARLGERRLPRLRQLAPYGTLLTALAVLTVGTGLLLRSLLGL